MKKIHIEWYTTKIVWGENVPKSYLIRRLGKIVSFFIFF